MGGKFASGTTEKDFANAAVYMLKIFYWVYKPTGKLLPIMVHCDNDFETMALKHSVAFDKPSGAGRRLENKLASCPFMPSFLDETDASFAETRKSSGSFLKTLYRFAEVLMGKDLVRSGTSTRKTNLFNPND